MSYVIMLVWLSVAIESIQQMSLVTVHKKTMHNALKTIFELRPPLPTTTFVLCSSKFEVSSPCSHGDMSKNIRGPPVLKFCKKIAMNIATYVARRSPYSRCLCKIRGPTH